VPRQAALRWIRERNGERIDQALVLFFPGPHSFTGEDCLEFHLHGGRAVVNAVLDLLRSFGLRHAEAGEFSRRAFENGKLDLVAIEGLADLVSAETEMQRRLAIEQSDGRLSALYHSWMQALTRARALIEAELDFPDEDDVPGSVSDAVWRNVTNLVSEIERHLAAHKSAEIIRDGFRVVIAGRPNAGKSSLLNTLAKRDVAIVTEVAGTTRDLISVDLDLGGYLVRLTDTAGLRETADLVEAEGVRRTRRSLEDADLVLLLRDRNDSGAYEKIDVNAPVVLVVTKVDETGPTEDPESDLQISSLTGAGIDSLTKRIQTEAEKASGARSTMIARQRQVDLLKEAVGILRHAVEAERLDLELRSEHLRLASHILGKLTGQVDVEDLLDVIFSEFCIGK
jgi:tRNA modification GTPase